MMVNNNNCPYTSAYLPLVSIYTWAGNIANFCDESFKDI